jgi:hypothetical protein
MDKDSIAALEDALLSSSSFGDDTVTLTMRKEVFERAMKALCDMPQRHYNCWTIWTEGTKQPFAQIGRPQDWGAPNWMYRVYYFQDNEHLNEVHCWLNATVQEHEHAELFSSLIVQILYPGTPRELCGKEFLDEDDFWDEAWGEAPPFYNPDEEDEEEL